MAASRVHRYRSRKSRNKNEMSMRWFFRKCNVRSYERINNWIAQNTIKVVPSDEDVIDKSDVTA